MHRPNASIASNFPEHETSKEYFRYLCSNVCDCLFAGTNQSRNDQKKWMLHRDAHLQKLIQDPTVHPLYRFDAQLEVTSKEQCVCFVAQDQIRVYSGGISCV